jgi:magnesium-transporting ATPase (P-type)
MTSVMITGDNALTAIAVARKCGIIGLKDKVFLADLEEQEEKE